MDDTWAVRDVFRKICVEKHIGGRRTGERTMQRDARILLISNEK